MARDYVFDTTLERSGKTPNGGDADYELDVRVVYRVSPGERQTYDYPGSDPEMEIISVVITDPTHAYWLSTKALELDTDELHDSGELAKLEEAAWRDVESRHGDEDPDC